jgi:hypothetical protein
MNARQELEEIQKKLQLWGNQVPADCDRFHKARLELLSSLNERLGSWWGTIPFIQADRMRTLHEAAQELEQAKLKLLELLEIRASALNEAEVLRTGTRRLRTKAVKEYIAARCNKWGAELILFGKSTVTFSEVNEEFQLLQRLNTTIARHREAVDLFIEADDLSAESGGLPALERQMFAEKVKDIPAEFVQQGATPALIERLTSAVNGAREKRRIVERERESEKKHRAPAIDPNVLRYKRADAGQWVEVVGDDPSRVDNLGLEELDQLLRASRAKAEQMRDACLADLRLRSRYLREACGPVPNVDNAIAQLEKKTWAGVREFDTFRKQEKEVQSLILSTAEIQPQKLAEALHTKLNSLQTNLKSLRESVHSRNDEIAAAGLDADILRLRNAAGNPKATLDSLLECGRCEDRLHRLKADIAAALAGLTADVDALRTRIDHLHEFQLREKLSAAGDWNKIVAEIAPMQTPSADKLLDQYRAALKQIVDRVEESEQAMRAHVQVRLASIEHETRRAVDALKLFDASFEDSMSKFTESIPFEIPELRHLLENATAYQSRLQTSLANALESEWKKAKSQAAELRELSDSGAIRSGDAAAGDSGSGRAVKDLLKTLSNLEAAPNADPADTLSNLARWRRRVEGLLEGVKGEERAVRIKQSLLRARLRNNFTYEAWNVYYPSYVERARALVDGVPDGPANYSALHRQLEAAETILKEIEADFRRRIADEVAADRMAAEDLLKLSQTPARWKQQIRAVLSELDRTKNRTPALETRQRLSRLKHRQVEEA